MSSELRSSYDRRQSGAAKDFKINPYKTLTKIKIPTIKLSSTGGVEGIRTLETLPSAPLAGVCLRPLGHHSADPFKG